MSKEDDLNTTLIDPEVNDVPSSPEFTKGEEQPKSCRDAWAAILFYGNMIAIAVVAGMFGVPAIQKYNKDFDQTLGEAITGAGDMDIYYQGILYSCLIAAGASFLFSGLSLFVMSCCPKFLIQISLLFSLVLSAVMVAVAFFYKQYIAGALGLVFFLISLCYAYYVWRRIPFAAANLNTGLTAIKLNAGIVIMSYLITIAGFFYMMLWMVAVVGVYDKEKVTTTTHDDGGTTEKSESTVGGGYFFLLLVALFWSQQVFTNTIHVTVAGVVSTWWYSPEEARSCCSAGVRDSFVRATTTSFGSICFGSLLVAIIKALRVMAESARGDADDGCAAFLLCLVTCLLRCLEDILEYFNKFAFIYVGMYGYSYIEAGKNVMTMFKHRGWSIIIADDLVSNVLFLFTLIIGGLTGCVGLVLNETNPEWFEGYEGGAMGVAFGFTFLVGVVIASIMLSIVDSAVNTVLVAFGEGPAEFEQNHPELSAEMHEGWRKVFPDDCGF